MAINLRAVKTLGSNFDPRKIPGLVGWYDSADLSTVYTTDAGPVTAVSSPLDISGCVGWWDASDAATISDTGGAVDQWDDKSGQGNNATASSTARPTTGTRSLNGRNVIDFDGSANTMQTALADAATQTLLFVAVSDVADSNGRVWSYGTSLRSAFPSSGAWNFWRQQTSGAIAIGASATSPSVAALVFASNSSLTPFANGAGAASGDPSDSIGGTFRIGSESTNYHNGYIAEIIVYNTALSTADRARVEAYLAAKWGISGVHALATANNAPVGYLGDKSGNNRHAIQTVSANRPTLWVTSPRSGFFTIRNTQNANKSLNIDGWEYVDESTQFVVFRADNTNNGLFDRGSLNDEPRLAIQNSAGVPSILASQGGSASASTNSAIGYPLSEWAIGGSIFTSSTTRAYRDGVYGPLTTGGNHSFSGDQPLRLLSLANNIYGLLGGIAEVIYYDKQLTEIEIEAVAQYLSKKWKINLAPKVSNAEAQDYINRIYAAGSSIDTTAANAINDFVTGCQNDGIWDSIKACCILCGANSLAGALVPLVGTAPTNNNFVSSDYDRLTGLKGDGSTKYLDTNRAGDADPQNDHHMSVFQSNLGTGSPMGSGAGSPGATHLAAASGSQFGARNRSSSFGGTGITPVVGFVGTSRTEAASFTIRYPGGSQALSVTSQTPYSLSYWVFGRNDATPGFEAFSDARIAFYSVGESLDLAALDNRVSALITAIQNSV